MYNLSLGIIANIVGIVMGLFGVVPLYQAHPALAGAALAALGSWIAIVFAAHWNRTLRAIKRGVAEIEEHLKKKGFHPDIIVAFTRTSAVVAGMLAVRMKLPELLVVNRHPISNDQTKSRTFRVGDGISLDAAKFRGRKVLVVSYLIETGSSLECGIEFLRSQEIPTEDIKIVSLYATPGAHHRFPNIYAVHETSKEVLQNLPWIDGVYDRL